MTDRGKANKENIWLRDATISLSYVTGGQFDEWVRPEKMVGEKRSGWCRHQEISSYLQK
jgi:hypothetical protein